MMSRLLLLLILCVALAVFRAVAIVLAVVLLLTLLAAQIAFLGPLLGSLSRPIGGTSSSRAPVPVADWQGIDATSSPLKLRGCFHVAPGAFAAAAPAPEITTFGPARSRPRSTSPR